MNNLGLCIALHDITHIGDSYIIPGDGSAHIKVTFRYLIFRPIINEVIEGKVKLCDSEGIHGMYAFRSLFFNFLVF
jgi:DNA-directed RNA polymerase III subunit RPC8